MWWTPPPFQLWTVFWDLKFLWELSSLKKHMGAYWTTCGGASGSVCEDETVLQSRLQWRSFSSSWTQRSRQYIVTLKGRSNTQTEGSDRSEFDAPEYFNFILDVSAFVHNEDKPSSSHVPSPVALILIKTWRLLKRPSAFVTFNISLIILLSARCDVPQRRSAHF